MKSYRELLAWQKAMDLFEIIYRITQEFPADERFGLVSQLRRAAVSVPWNIAEGRARPTADFVRFLKTSRGSLSEIETQLEISRRLGFLTDITEATSLAAKTGRIINGLIRSLRDTAP